MSARVLNWDVALITWACAQQGRPFRWGRTDCATLVRRAHRVMFGRDVFAAVPRWQSLREARRVLGSTGGVASCLERLGAEYYLLSFAQAGDVVIGQPVDGLAASAVVLGNTALVSTRELGVRIIPLTELERGVEVWRLSHV